MAYPTGSGSEQLYNGTIHAQSNSASAFKFDGTQNSTVGTNTAVVPALHIITVLNITITDQEDNNGGLYLSMLDSGSNTIRLLENHNYGALDTFVFNEKIVLRGGDKLFINCGGGSANIDVFYCYIDQNWE